jgi:hypothetical protein
MELSMDQLEQRLVSDESLIAQLRARQLHDLARLDRAQVATGDGSRSMSEWVAARVDVSIETARTLLRNGLVSRPTPSKGRRRTDSW